MGQHRISDRVPNRVNPLLARLQALIDGKIRSCFAMTEKQVASSDATNIQSSIVREGDEYVINGHKWWTSGIGDPRCKVIIFMAKNDPKAEPYKQQSMILVPADTPGIKVHRMLTVMGYDDAPHGHGEVEFKDVREIEELEYGEFVLQCAKRDYTFKAPDETKCQVIVHNLRQLRERWRAGPWGQSWRG